MVREDIIAGLRSAVAKKESLKQAMISFYNAGYKREEIQEAARALQEEQLTLGIQQPQLAQQPQMQQQPVQMQQPQFVQQPVQQMQPGRPVQVVSGYAPQKKTGKILIIVLVVVLVLLVGFLATIFIFRDKLADILGGLI